MDIKKEINKIFIDGKWIVSCSSNKRELINPVTEKVWANITMGTEEDVERAVIAARRAFQSFSQTTTTERMELLRRIERILHRRGQEIADTVTQEIAIPISVSRTSLLDWCYMHTTATISILNSFSFSERLGTTTVYKEPIGVVGLITPWNFPVGQIFTKILPALATGCTMILKPSELAPLDAIIVAEILEEAGVPPGVFNLVIGDGSTVGKAISQHSDIDMV